MPIWSAEIKELEKLYESIKGQFPDLEKELERLIKADDENMILLYSRRCLEVIITDLCECELKRPRKTEPLKGIIDKLNKEEKVPSNIITSMDHLNSLSAYGAHPKDFDPEQVKPVLVNLDIIIKWFLKHKVTSTVTNAKSIAENRDNIKSAEEINKHTTNPKKKFIVIICSIIAVILIVIMVLLLSNKELEKSIAVLPFINESPVDSNKHFINGIMEEVLNNLQTIKEFRVLSRTSTDQYKGPDRPTMPEIAKKLHVSYLVEGSGQKYGNTVTLRVQLIRAKRKESHIWAHTYNEEIREVRDYVRIQSDVAKKIAAELKVEMTGGEKQIIEKIPTSNLSAYDLYLKANNYLKEYENTLDLSYYHTSVNLYKEALKEDSAFARAYTGLANAYLIRNKWEDFFKENYLDSMLTLIDKAIAIDDKLDEAYYLKGKYYQETGQFDEALDNYGKALKINPNYFSPYYEKAGILIWVKQDFVKGLESIHKSSNLDFGNDRPDGLRGVGYVYLLAGFPDKAKYFFQEALKLDGDSASYFINMARLEFSIDNLKNAVIYNEKASRIDSTINGPSEYYSFTGQDEKAYLDFKKAIENIKKTGEKPLAYSHRIGYAFLRAGKSEEAKYYFNQQIKFGEDSILVNRYYLQRTSVCYDLAATYAFLGDTLKAYKYLDEYNKMDFYPSSIISYFKHDVLFNSIRNEERFQKILQNIETKYQAEHERVRKWLEEQGML